MTFKKINIIGQIDTVLANFQTNQQLIRRGEKDQEKIWQQSLSRIYAAICRLSSANSTYKANADQVINDPKNHISIQVDYLAGILESLKADYESGYMDSLQEILHADLFSDFLEMAEHLLNEGYKDPSAVIAGSTLEEHLRKLCVRFGIDPINHTAKGDKPYKADFLNAELAKADVYNKLDQKSVTAWLDLRNNAAHGNYDQYDHTQVAGMIQSIRDFMIRNPA